MFHGGSVVAGGDADSVALRRVPPRWAAISLDALEGIASRRDGLRALRRAARCAVASVV